MSRSGPPRGRTADPDPSPGPPGDPVPAPAASGGNDVRRKDLTRVAQDGALKLGGSILSDVLGFVFVVIAVRGFGKADAGRFFEAMALVTILSNIAKLGADTGFVRFIPRYRVTGRTRDIRPALLIGIVPVAVLGVALGAVAFFFGPQLANVLSKKAPAQLVPYLRVLAVFLPAITVYAVALAASRGFGTIKPLVVVDNVLVPGGRTVAALAALVAALGGVALAYTTGTAIAVGLVIVLLWTYRLLARAERRDAGDPGSTSRTPNAALFGEFWRFAGPRGLASVFATLQSNISILLLGALSTVGAGAVGVFAAATRFMKFGTLARIAIFFVISPQISGFLARGDRERAQAVYEVSTWWVMIGSWPVYIVLAVWAPLLMKLFGKGMVSGATALTILSLAMLVSMAAGPVQVVLLMDGRAMWNLINTAVALGVVIVLSFVLIPSYGVDGAAIAMAAAIVVNNVAAFVQVSVLMKLRTTGSGFWITAATSLLAFGVVGLGFRSLIGPTFPAFVAFAVLSSALYLVILLRFRQVLELDVLWDAVVRRGRGRQGAGRGPRSGALPVGTYQGRHRAFGRDTGDSPSAVGAGPGEGLQAGEAAAMEADLELDAEDQQGL